MKRTGLKKNIAISTLYQILSMILPLITAPYASRVLGVDGIGVYSYTHSYSMYFTLFAALGTVTYGTREIARSRNDRKITSQLFWEIESLTIVTSMVCILVWVIMTLLWKEYRLYFALLTPLLIGTMFDISWLFAGLEQFKYTVTQNLTFKILGVVAIFIFVNDKNDLWKYVLILSVSHALASISMWLYIPKFVDRVPLKSIHIKKHFKETLVYFIPTIAISIYTVLDKTLIGLITNSKSENGNYEQATKIINISKTVAFTGVNMVLQSRISYLFAEHKYKEIKNKIKDSINFVSFLSIGMVFGLIAVSQRFVPIFFGSGYEKTITLIKLMSPLVFIIGISNCLGSQFYSPAGLRSQSAKYIVSGAIINFILNLLLIPLLRSEGAIIATIVAETVISSLYVYNSKGYFNLKDLVKLIWKKIIAGAAMLVVVMLLDRVQGKGILPLLIQITVGVMVYSIVLLILRDSFFSELVAKLLKKKTKKNNKDEIVKGDT